MSGNRTKSAFFEWGWVTLSADFREKGALPTNHCWYQSSRVIALSCGIKIFAVRRLVLSQYTRVTNGRTDRITTPKIALAYARVVKSSLVYTAPNQELKPMSRVEQRPVICSSPPVQIALVVLLILMLTMFWLKKIMVITQRVVRGTHYTTMINQHQLFASQPHKIQGGYV